MTEDELNELFGDDVIVKASIDALNMVEEQMANPDVYNDRTSDALARISGFAGYLKSKAADMKINGKKDAATYLEAQVKSLEYLMAALKYKMQANR